VELYNYFTCVSSLLEQEKVYGEKGKFSSFQASRHMGNRRHSCTHFNLSVRWRSVKPEILCIS